MTENEIVADKLFQSILTAEQELKPYMKSLSALELHNRHTILVDITYHIAEARKRAATLGLSPEFKREAQ